jgi:hypothetical protein
VKIFGIKKGGENMARKTKDVWCIDTNYGYGWETESTYTEDDYENPEQSAREDAKEYRAMSQHPQVRVYKKRVPLE